MRKIYEKIFVSVDVYQSGPLCLKSGGNTPPKPSVWGSTRLLCEVEHTMQFWKSTLEPE